MVSLFDQNVRTYDRQSSKGNQLKWENEGVWYKADYTGYEGLSEYIVSNLLRKTSLLPEEYVRYTTEEINYRRTIYLGAKSNNFLTDNWQIITLERLFKTFFGESLNRCIYRISDLDKRLLFLCTQVERITGISDFGIYMNKLFTIDALFLNEDRHTHNIAVLMNDKREFRLCPIFDFGASILSDTTMDYPLADNPLDLISSVEAKTISFDFEEQMDISEQLYGNHLKFFFTAADIHALLTSKEASIYSEEICNRVEIILLEQMRKYQYLFFR